jgi:RNA polymerase sigma-70 factor (ECF subfamily)
MTDEPIDDLLEQLRQGDAGAAERLLAAYGPYLRVVVRRQLPRRLRAKFDSADVVQSVWARLFDGLRAGRWRFAAPGQLRAFLATAARHRLTDRVRQHRRAAEGERPLVPEALPPGGGPRPSELAQADDLWDKMLALSPPAHHELLRLRAQGLPLEEIAARTGLHEGSVRRALRQLARRMALGEGPPPS